MRYQALFTSLMVASALAAVQPVLLKRQLSPAMNPSGVGIFIKASGATTAESPLATGGPEGGVSSGNEEPKEGEEKKEEPKEGEAPPEGEAAPEGEAPPEGEGKGEAPPEGGKEGEGKGGVDDAGIFNFALTLERLETEFYQQAAQALSLKQWEKLGISGGSAQLISDTLSAIAQDENSHVSIISTTLASLGAEVSTKCSFEFGQAVQDPFTFLSVARAMEYVGTSAYLGAVPALSDKSLLLAAATITTIEARHSSLLNVFSGGDAIPQGFDMPLTPPEVLGLVGGFLQDCVASDLGFESTNPLLVAAANDGSSVINIGTKLAFASVAQIDEDNDFCQMLIGGQSAATVQPVRNCVVSPNIATSGLKLDGPVYVWITKDSKPIAADVNSRDLSNLVAGPALFFLDNPERKNQILTAPLNIQALGSANLGINQFGDVISPLAGGRNQQGQKGSLQQSGFLSQSDVVYTADGQKKSYDLGKKEVRRQKRTTMARQRRHRLAALH